MQTVSVSALKYANDKFKDTPALLPLENFNINNLSFENENDRKQLTEILIYNAKQKSLDKLLGDHIVKCYKKENPEEQSFHTTDCSRLNYIVRNLIENALTWSVDKNGIKICSSIIKPLIEKCINLLLDHQKN
jgi:signal transduction histidine kinase